MYSAVDIGVLEDGRLDAFIIGDSGILGGFFVLESVVTRTNVRFLDGARTVNGRVPAETHQRAVAPRQLRAVSPTNQEIREGRVLLDPRLLMVDPMVAADRLRGRLDDDPRRGPLFGVRRLLPARGVVLHLEAGNGVVQTTVLPAAGVLPAGESALESLDRLERPRSLDLLPLFRLAAGRRGRPLVLGRLEDPRQRLHLPTHLTGQRLLRVSLAARRKAVIVAQGARKRAGRRRLRRAADGEGVAGEFLVSAAAVRRVALSQFGDRLPRRLAAVQRHVKRGPPLRRFLGILSGQHVFAFLESPSGMREIRGTVASRHKSHRPTGCRSRGPSCPELSCLPRHGRTPISLHKRQQDRR